MTTKAKQQWTPGPWRAVGVKRQTPGGTPAFGEPKLSPSSRKDRRNASAVHCLYSTSPTNFQEIPHSLQEAERILDKIGGAS